MDDWKQAAKLALEEGRDAVALAIAIRGATLEEGTTPWHVLWEYAAKRSLDGPRTAVLLKELRLYLVGQTIGWPRLSVAAHQFATVESSGNYHHAADLREAEQLTKQEAYVVRPGVYDPLIADVRTKIAACASAARNGRPEFTGITGPWRSGKTLALRWLLKQMAGLDRIAIYCTGEIAADSAAIWLVSHLGNNGSVLQQFDGAFIVGIDLDGSGNGDIVCRTLHKLPSETRSRVSIVVTGWRSDVRRWCKNENICDFAKLLEATYPGVGGDPVRSFSFPVIPLWDIDIEGAAASLFDRARRVGLGDSSPTPLDALLLVNALLVDTEDPPEDLLFRGVRLMDVARDMDLIPHPRSRRRVMRHDVALQVLRHRYSAVWIHYAAEILAAWLRTDARESGGAWLRPLDVLITALSAGHRDLTHFESACLVLLAVGARLADQSQPPEVVVIAQLLPLLQPLRAWWSNPGKAVSRDPDWPWGSNPEDHGAVLDHPRLASVHGGSLVATRQAGPGESGVSPSAGDGSADVEEPAFSISDAGIPPAPPDPLPDRSLKPESIPPIRLYHVDSRAVLSDQMLKIVDYELKQFAWGHDQYTQIGRQSERWSEALREIESRLLERFDRRMDLSSEEVVLLMSIVQRHMKEP